MSRTRHWDASAACSLQASTSVGPSCAAPTCAAPTGSACQCEHCQHLRSGVVEHSDVWSTVEVPPAQEEQNLIDVVPSPRQLSDDEEDDPNSSIPPLQKPLKQPADDTPNPIELMPMDEDLIEPISYRTSSGASKASSAVTAAAFIIDLGDHTQPSVAEDVEEERILLPVTRVARRRIQ